MGSLLNITSVLLKKVILEADSDTWANIRKHYLPPEFQDVWSVINKHFETVGGIPSFDALKLSIRSSALLDKIYAVEAAEDVDIPNDVLLDFLKNEYTQEEIMEQLGQYLDETIMISTAQESVDRLQQIVLHIEDRVDLKDPQESMQTIDLFPTEEELAAMFALGLNTEHDAMVKFAPGDLILIGGKRGAGKSIASCNVAINATEGLKKPAVYFTIEMPPKAILRRCCAIATGVSASGLKRRDLTHHEWEQAATWWASRFEESDQALKEYLKEHHDFNKLHQVLSKKHTLKKSNLLDIVYDPSLSISKIRSTLDRKMSASNEEEKPAVVVVDYVNQVKRGFTLKYHGQYDWTEQIEISKHLKTIAQEYGVPMVSPFQIDAQGEARFAKGLLDAVDGAYNLNAWTKQDSCMTFENAKMRDDDEISFTSHIDWRSLKIGPQSVVRPDQRSEEDTEPVNDM